MSAASPRYLLFAAAARRSCQPHRWRFLLEPVGGEGQRLAASDVEPGIDRNRLELLAVVRGLEALEQPSRVSLLTGSRYVHRGIAHDLAHWRDENWCWECFGRWVPIRDHDLWQRVDRALGIHQLECLRWQWGEEDRDPHAADVLASLSRSAECPAAGRHSTGGAPDDGSRWQLRRGVFRPRRSRTRPRAIDWGLGALAALAAVGRPTLSRTS